MLIIYLITAYRAAYGLLRIIRNYNGHAVQVTQGGCRGAEHSSGSGWGVHPAIVCFVVRRIFKPKSHRLAQLRFRTSKWHHATLMHMIQQIDPGQI